MNKSTMTLARLLRLNRRQRKKLRLGEFQELGFEASATFCIPFQYDDGVYDAFLVAFIDFIESRDLLFGGMGGAFPLAKTDAFVTTSKRGSTTDEDRHAVLAWLQARPEIAHAQVGEFIDAWHGGA